MTPSERLKMYLKEHRGLQKQLAEHLNIPASTFNNWLNRTSELPASAIIPISEYLKLEPTYLLTGEENTPSEPADETVLTKDERFLLRYYAQLSEDDQAVVLQDVATKAQRSAPARPAMATKGKGSSVAPAGEPAPAKIARAKAPPGSPKDEQKQA